MSPLQIFYRICFQAGAKKDSATHSGVNSIFLSVNQGESLVYMSLSILDTNQQSMPYPGNPVQALRRLLAIRGLRLIGLPREQLCTLPGLHNVNHSPCGRHNCIGGNLMRGLNGSRDHLCAIYSWNIRA